LTRSGRIAVACVLGVWLLAIAFALIAACNAIQAPRRQPLTPIAIAAEIADDGRNLDGADDFADLFSVEASAAENDASLESPTTDLNGEEDLAAEPQPIRWTDADVRDALDGQSVMTRRIVFCEIGRSGAYDPYAIGPKEEIGPAQLLPGPDNGLAIFYRWGGEDPHSPYEAVRFINRVQAERMLASQYPRTRFGCPGSI